MTARAASAPAGADGLFFMPYLTGERLGAHRNARAQFFGLGAAHGLAHLHRAVLEGVAFAAARHLRIMERAAGPQAGAGDRLGRRRQDGALAEDQGERLRRADRRAEGAGMRRHRLRRAWRRPRRGASPTSKTPSAPTCAMSTRSQARSGLGRNLRADAAGVRPALRAFSQALYDDLDALAADRRARARSHLQDVGIMDEILATFRPDLFAGKRVLISGGTSGIGLCLAKAFARLGAEVTATGASQAASRRRARGRRSQGRSLRSASTCATARRSTPSSARFRGWTCSSTRPASRSRRRNMRKTASST